MRRVYLVEGDSMSPAFRDGDLVVVGPGARSCEVGDVVVYRRCEPPFLVVHRVVETAGPVLVTQGDAVASPDPELVPADAIAGVVRWRIPRIGRLLRKETH